MIAANQRVHTVLAKQYNQVEPHFRPENRLKVRKRLEHIASLAPSRHRLLDIGCGTGFIIDLVHDLFDQVEGIDATQSMLDQVDLSPGNVAVRQGKVEDLPFENSSFDVVTAYSFLDHLADYSIALREAHRVLRPNGVVYADLIPNRHFWDAIYSAHLSTTIELPPLVQREVNELVNHEQKMESLYGIPPEDWRLAEPSKSHTRGLDPQVLLADLDQIGFNSSISFEWFLGEAKVFHETSPVAAAQTNSHLQEILPVTQSLFKYLVLVGIKR